MTPAKADIADLFNDFYKEVHTKEAIRIALEFFNRCTQDGFDDSKELKILKLKKEAMDQERSISREAIKKLKGA